jgi:molybdopterin-containing oxidoreductase family membrane subunit
VVGAVYSGFAMVMTVLLVARRIFRLERVVLPVHLELMNKVLLLTGMLVGFAYATELFMAWYSGNPYELDVFSNRATGPYAWTYWTMIGCNVLAVQVFWSKRMRNSVPVMFAVSILVNVGMWFERFVIIVTSLQHDFLPSSWGMFHPTLIDVGTFTGSLGVFFAGFLLFMRWLPVVAMSEVKGTMPQADPHLVAGPGLGPSPLGIAIGGPP